jgi:signal peptidase II
MNKRVAYIILLILLNIGLDQFSKHLVRTEVVAGSRTEIVGKLLQLMNVENSGAFLGIGSNSNPTVKLIFLLILPVIVLGIVLYYLFSNSNLDNISVIGFSCVAGGGIANLYDRFVYGSVTDFLFMDFGFTQTGIFNIADLSVTTGMILLIVASYQQKRKDKKLTS